MFGVGAVADGVPCPETIYMYNNHVPTEFFPRLSNSQVSIEGKTPLINKGTEEYQLPADLVRRV